MTTKSYTSLLLILLFTLTYSCKTPESTSELSGKVNANVIDRGAPVRISPTLVKYIGIPASIDGAHDLTCRTLSSGIKSSGGELFLILFSRDFKGNCNQISLEVRMDSVTYKDMLTLYRYPRRIGFQSDAQIVGLIKISPTLLKKIREQIAHNDSGNSNVTIQQMISSAPRGEIELQSLCNETFEKKCDFVMEADGIVQISYNN